MSRFTPRAAVRTGSKCRLALSGPSGAGKTWTALECATVLAEGEPILVIDTERGSAALYSDYYGFDEIAWTPPYDPRELASVIAEQAPNYAVVVVDSLSHFWEAEGGTRDIVDAAAARARGNSFAGWKEGTPAQNEMVGGMLKAPCHIICGIRSKVEYVLQPDSHGKQVPKRIGMAPVQRQGIEYEFTVTADLDLEHTLLIDKTRCHPLAGRMFKAGHAAEMAEILRDWLAGAGEAEPEPPGRMFRDVRRLMLEAAVDVPDPRALAVRVWHEHEPAGEPVTDDELQTLLDAMGDALADLDDGTENPYPDPDDDLAEQPDGVADQDDEPVEAEIVDEP